MSRFKLLSKSLRDSSRRSATRPRRPARARLALEALAERLLPAITATFTLADGTLRINGDALDNTIVVSRNTNFGFLVNGGAVPIQGGPATITNTNSIVINGGAGNDIISLDETNGFLPAAA